MQKLTSVRKRLDHVLNELDLLSSEPNEKTVNNIIVELAIIKKAYKTSQQVPMCCFRYDTDRRVVCDVVGPLSSEQFMQECKRCQVQIKTLLAELKTN